MTIENLVLKAEKDCESIFRQIEQNEYYFSIICFSKREYK